MVLMNVAVVVFLTGTVLWLCYWALVRPVILDSVERELVHMKTNLDWAIINGEIGAQSEAAKILERDLAFPSSIRWVSLGIVIKSNLHNRVEMAALNSKEQKIFECSPPWIREMWDRHTVISVKAALANSPSWWLPLSMILLVCFFSMKVQDWWNNIERATSKARIAIPATA
jgi:hypothetical protein